MNQVFDSYARYYDLLYRDKNYAAEAEYIVAQLRTYIPDGGRVLELGCGTGIHAEYLARAGYSVHGMDLSPVMLATAEARRASLPPEVASRLSFSGGDARTVRTGKSYDAVMSLFHVMSYQETNCDLSATFETAHAHLQTGGIFMFDFWYGPAVLTQKPVVRVKRLENDEITITRIAEPILHLNENLVDVNYSMFIQSRDSGAIERIQETHRMRYLFLPEMKAYWQGKFDQIASYGWLSNQPPDAESWACVQVLCRI